jgi:DNA-binding response OmpR family regulator
VLVVEDAEPVRGLIVRTLAGDGFHVTEASTATEARALLSDSKPQVVVLDLGLPDESGLDLLREVVTAGVPVVVLTSRGEETDRILGLKVGADDYMVKPFFPSELAIRVQRAAARARVTPPELGGGGLVIDRGTREVSVDGSTVAVTDREFDLLAHLASSPRQVFSRDDLLRDVWRSSPDWQSAATVLPYVHRLRAKLERDPVHPTLIVTVGRAGYRFEPRQRP